MFKRFVYPRERCRSGANGMINEYSIIIIYSTKKQINEDCFSWCGAHSYRL